MIDNPKLFLDQKNIFWQYYLGHCFILVCSEDENILMASNFLTILETFAKEEYVKLLIFKFQSNIYLYLKSTLLAKFNRKFFGYS